MAMLGAFVAGAYTSTYAPGGSGGGAMGLTKEGYRLRWSYDTDDINQTDGYGSTTIEMFLHGLNMWIGGIWMEWNANVVGAANPWGEYTNTGVSHLSLGIVARAATTVGGTMVLTTVAGTPAASSPATMTIPVAIQDKGFNVEYLLGPTHREVPFLYRIMPTTVSSRTQFFSTT